MDIPIAGFAFSVKEKEVAGSWGEWSTEGLDPLEQYSPESAEERFRRLVPYTDLPENEEDVKEDDLDAALERFINSELEEDNDEEDDEDELMLNDFFTDCAESSPTHNVEDNPETETEDETTQFYDSLSQLTGLSTIKEKLMTYEKLVRFNKLREDNNLPALSTPLHAMFLGSPGTGKTTVAEMIGKMLRRAGILSRGHVIVRERSMLLGQYYSSTHERTLEAIEKAQGGILLIDEAYQLFQPDDPRDPGISVIDTLMTALADESKRDWMLILAGYPKETKRMFDMNPGLKSRIPDSNIYM
ncbi:MAG: AAA family ATPase, partial [Paramuribaculum sp.]|nr:AAA family ATPase [Paramuribaculum sp.]